MKKQLSVIIERDEDGLYVASVPALKGCHTQAHSIDELLERIKEAAELCLEVQGEDYTEIEFIGVHEIEVEV